MTDATCEHEQVPDSMAPRVPAIQHEEYDSRRVEHAADADVDESVDLGADVVGPLGVALRHVHRPARAADLVDGFLNGLCVVSLTIAFRAGIHQLGVRPARRRGLRGLPIPRA